MLPSWWTVGGCGSLGVSEEMGLADVIDKKDSVILLYLHSMVKIQMFSPFFRFSGDGLHAWGLLLVISLGFQEIGHQTLFMIQP